MLFNHMGTQTIETKRLILRKFEITDTKSVFKNWISSREVQENYGEMSIQLKL
ncbi:hypothetical protein [Clostridium arbusti]|uniref:hypothetical protein n=1 Tax=Clostridium arbusti TaxID=1137848 RepID=UPI000289E4D6|nr:hypothetical protein [Clostridium arbusti]